MSVEETVGKSSGANVVSLDIEILTVRKRQSFTIKMTYMHNSKSKKAGPGTKNVFHNTIKHSEFFFTIPVFTFHLDKISKDSDISVAL